MPLSLEHPASVVLLLTAALWVSGATASTVPYPAKSDTPKGLVNFPELPEKPFAALLRPDEEHRAEILRSLQCRKPDHRWDRHAHPAKGHGPHDGHQGSHDDATDDDTTTTPPAGPGDVTGSNPGGTTTPPTPPLPADHPPITPAPSAVPVPGALWLFLSGIIGLGSVGRSRRR